MGTAGKHHLRCGLQGLPTKKFGILHIVRFHKLPPSKFLTLLYAVFLPSLANHDEKIVVRRLQAV